MDGPRLACCALLPTRGGFATEEAARRLSANDLTALGSRLKRLHTASADRGLIHFRPTFELRSMPRTILGVQPPTIRGAAQGLSQILVAALRARFGLGKFWATAQKAYTNQALRTAVLHIAPLAYARAACASCQA